MRMLAPRLGDTPRYVVVAEEQDEYKPVTAALVANPLYPVRSDTGVNTHVVAYQPTPDEIAALQRGELIYLHLLTFGHAMQPHIISIGDVSARSMYGLPDSGEER